MFIKSNATVDTLRPPLDGVDGQFTVNVWGIEPPYDYNRTYTITARDENIAARIGIDRFVAEMEKLLSSGN